MYKYVFLITLGACTLPLFCSDKDKEQKKVISSARAPDRPLRPDPMIAPISYIKSFLNSSNNGR